METSFYGSLENYSNEDFTALSDSRFGWAISAQVRDILNGDSYEDQNPNALKEIAYFARSKKEIELAESIENYLSQFD